MIGWNLILQLNWGSGSSPFSTDPFGSQQTPTDPFSAASGSDPFGDNPFTAKPANSNAFASDAGWGSTIGKVMLNDPYPIVI